LRRKSTGRNIKTAIPPRSISWDEYLIKSIKDPKAAQGYLNAALDDSDPRVFLLALRDVAEAHGGVGKITRNPSLQSLGKLLSSMGFRLAIEKKDAA
jgi:DNA-binding phage protein